MGALRPAIRRQESTPNCSTWVSERGRARGGHSQIVVRGLVKGGRGVRHTALDMTIKVIPGANHLYQAATTGSASEYPRLKKEFAPGFLDTVVSWLSRRLPVTSSART